MIKGAHRPDGGRQVLVLIDLVFEPLCAVYVAHDMAPVLHITKPSNIRTLLYQYPWHMAPVMHVHVHVHVHGIKYM